MSGVFALFSKKRAFFKVFMENGKYTKKLVNFKKITLKKFTPCLYASPIYSMMGCGANTISLLTGVNPYQVVQENKNRSHYSDRFMLRQLKKHGITAKKITKCNLTAKNKNNLSYNLKENHLLMISQLMKKNEASWMVYWNGICYHNFELTRADFWNILNFPIISAYCLYNPKWAKI